MSKATPSFSSRLATALANASPSLIRASVKRRQTEVVDAVAGSTARFAIQSRPLTKSATALAFASARAIRAGRPPIDFAHSSATM